MAPSKNVHPVPFPVYVVAFTPKKSRIVAGGGGGQSNSGIANGVVSVDDNDYLSVAGGWQYIDITCLEM